VQRPASRRASQQNAYHRDGGSHPQAPYDQAPYDQAPYDQAPYDQAPYDQGSYRRAPRQDGQYQYVSYEQAPYQQPPYGQQGPYGQGPHEPGGFEPGGPHGPGPFDPAGPNGPNGPNGPQPYEPDLSWPLPGRRRRGPGGSGGPGRRTGKVRRHRIRKLLKLRAVRVILALLLVFCCWVGFSVGQALAAPNGGSLASKLAEWARDHYLGPVVTFGEWLTYSPPKVGGKPTFSLAVPSGSAKYKHTKSFRPIIPRKLSSPAGTPLPGEGQWRVLETVKGEPAIFGTFLRPSSVYTSYVAGITSMDQRLVTFQLHPGAEDPGTAGFNSPAWIPPGSRTGLLATFNGGFKLDSAGGGFYLNGQTKGTLVNGAASVVYYRNGTIKIGSWGTEVKMTSQVVGVRQNLKLLVDHGRIPSSVNQNVIASWGATLGGGYYVWRSGLGITADGRVIYVYGPALNVQELASLLKQAGAVEAMQLDINPYWMSYEYYQAKGHPSDPTPVNLLPTQQQTAYRYYSVYSRDFTAVYAR
jgi:hypothetical protein